MKRIFKYKLKVADKQTIMMPRHSQILSIQEQGGDITLWALVDPFYQKEPAEYHFAIIGTGHPIEEMEPFTHLATIQTSGGFVWHIFQTMS